MYNVGIRETYRLMMESEFDFSAARKNLENKERLKQKGLEKDRISLMEKPIKILKKRFEGEAIEVLLVGSATCPGKFNQDSDIDIVLKNFKGDRFEIWPLLEREIG